jgi:signal transduction histidine kinase
MKHRGGGGDGDDLGGAGMSRRRTSDQYMDLRRRHDELRARYESLLQRLSEQAQAESAFHRLSWFALERSSSALALWRGRQVALANSRWHELARTPRHAASWSVAGDGEAPRCHPDLTTLALSEIERHPRRGVWTLRCERARPEQALRLTLERVPGRNGEGLVLLRGDDVTEELRRERALQELRDRHAQRERIVALGLLARGMAHDLGNTVNALGLHLELTERVSTPEVRARLEPLGRAVDSMRGALARLDRFSGWRARPVAVSLQGAVEGAAELVSVQLRGSGGRPAVRLRVDVPARLPKVAGQREDLTHVLVNLILNARDAMPDGGTVTITARRRQHQVVVTVEDEGSGFKPEDLPRAFEALFTTKGAAGHGLGLALAKATITSSGGTITAGNREGGGAVMTIELPLASRLPSRRR